MAIPDHCPIGTLQVVGHGHSTRVALSARSPRDYAADIQVCLAQMYNRDVDGSIGMGCLYSGAMRLVSRLGARL